MEILAEPLAASTQTAAEFRLEERNDSQRWSSLAEWSSAKSLFCFTPTLQCQLPGSEQLKDVLVSIVATTAVSAAASPVTAILAGQTISPGIPSGLVYLADVDHLPTLLAVPLCGTHLMYFSPFSLLK